MAKTQHFCASNFAALVAAFKEYETHVAERLSRHLWAHQTATATVAARARAPGASSTSASFVDMAAAAEAYAEPSELHPGGRPASAYSKGSGLGGSLSQSHHAQPPSTPERQQQNAAGPGTPMTPADAKRCINGAHLLVRKLLAELHQRRFVACTEVTHLAAALEQQFATAFCGGSVMAARAELTTLERAERAKQQRRQQRLQRQQQHPGRQGRGMTLEADDDWGGLRFDERGDEEGGGERLRRTRSSCARARCCRATST